MLIDLSQVKSANLHGIFADANLSRFVPDCDVGVGSDRRQPTATGQSIRW
jgi:hypothetical protein